MATKKFNELRASDWRMPAPVYLLEGEELVQQREFLTALRRALRLQPGSLDEATLDARETPIAALGGIVQTIPMEAERRLVLLHAVNRYNANDLQALAKLIPQTPPFACLVLLTSPADESESAKAAWNALTKAVEQHGMVVKLTALTGKTLTNRLVETAQAAGKQLRAEDAEYLQTLVDGVAERALAELEKVILFVEPHSEITRLDIDRTVSPSQQAQVFKLVDSLVARDAHAALRQLRLMFQSGTRAEEVALKTLALIARQYRLLWGVRALLQYQQPVKQPSKVSPEVAAKLPKDPDVLQTLQRQAFLQEKLLKQAERLSLAQLCGTFQAIYDADSALKGLSPSVNAAEIMERLIIRLTMDGEPTLPSHPQGG
ncbi:MAG: DNA polymerase III subunit delta [Fimbriimonadales bacterium]|nr:MAG: DNA polymerase III subunit delta [Fimbriimonadales bacterium]GIV09349.1 MAG: DNA polymerase III subunit delta [Fimbriimonadales bacterium]